MWSCTNETVVKTTNVFGNHYTWFFILFEIIEIFIVTNDIISGILTKPNRESAPEGITSLTNSLSSDDFFFSKDAVAAFLYFTTGLAKTDSCDARFVFNHSISYSKFQNLGWLESVSDIGLEVVLFLGDINTKTTNYT